MSRDLIESGLGWSWQSGRVMARIRSQDTMVLTARDREQVIGFAIMEFAELEAHLDLLAVLPSYRRAGIGRRLIQWLEKSARVAGTFMVHLEVRISNRSAQAFYRALSYQQMAWVPRYYGGYEDAVRMAHDLRVRR